MAATSSPAARNALSLAFEGLLKPVIFLTNCSEAARISSSLTGGSKLKRVLIFLHIQRHLLDNSGPESSVPYQLHSENTRTAGDRTEPCGEPKQTFRA